MRILTYINRVLLAILILPLIVLLNSCDEIEGNYVETKIDTTGETGANTRKVLLEEFTGFKCVNCPRATEIAHKIKDDDMRNRVVLVSVHSTFFAKPDGSGKYTYDFRTDDGNALADYFGVTSAPQAVINRAKYNNSYIINELDWAGRVDSYADSVPKMLIRLFPEYDAAKREIYVDVEIVYLTEGSPEHNLVLYITEDSIIQAQKDSRATPPDILNYVHENVLRASINGQWGDRLSKTAIPANYVLRREFKYVIPEGKDWKPEHLKIVAFVQDFGNSREVYQVEEKKLLR